MSIIQLTSDGILRGGVVRTAFFNEARTALINAGFKPTSWVDYLIAEKNDNMFYVSIKKSKLYVEGRSGFLFTTSKIERVLDLIK